MSFGKRTTHPIDVDLSVADFARIARLPREVGLWMARLDLGGGTSALSAEITAIDAFLDTAARKFATLPTLTTIIATSRAIKTPTAPLPEDSLFGQCDNIISILATYAPSHEVNAYKLLLIEMAECVARAGIELPSRWFRNKGPNVSRAEKEGINRLIDALNANDMVEKWVVGLPTFGPGVRAFTSPLTRVQQTASK